MAGTLVTAARRMIYLAGASFRGAVSEELIQRLGAAINFINLYQMMTKKFVVNGIFYAAVPINAIDGIEVFETDVEIVAVWMYCLEAGTSGTLEMDLEYMAAPGGAWASLFDTKPQIDWDAGDDVWVGIDDAVPNCVNPVLDAAAATLTAGAAIRANITAVQSGNPAYCGLIVHYRPR